MGFQGFLLFSLLVLANSLTVLANSLTSSEAISIKEGISVLNRTSFPEGFAFGAATSAYQNEGAWNTSGRGPSIWDTFTHRYPEKILDRSNGDVAVDCYHKYKEDVQLIKKLNLDSYRFSISWPRLLPHITPFVTIFHWDLPQTLEDEYGGFRSPRIVQGGYATGALAPGRCSAWMNPNCTGGDSGREPYMVTHNQLLAHAAAVKLYKEKYQKSQKGQIGITLVTRWMRAFTDTSLDYRASRRALDFFFGWFMGPLTTGDYPLTMRAIVRDRLPKFSPAEARMVMGSYDFLGLNYYTTNYAAHAPRPSRVNQSYTTDSWVNLTTRIDEFNNATIPVTEATRDWHRIQYYHDHLDNLRKAISIDGVRVKGYFAWSLMDNFEWYAGYTVRFEIIPLIPFEVYRGTQQVRFPYLKGQNTGKEEVISSFNVAVAKKASRRCWNTPARDYISSSELSMAKGPKDEGEFWKATQGGTKEWEEENIISSPRVKDT
ncbi:hypothetical protein F0562_001404 [Nyssa sinensis]|uniref:Beta-glucosidase n=1 Tax=Nyssa sinensis TaxID=561372 RepID=A0A5J5C2Q3_9ASTE|nr:hypothetical protein F0562_001404 [Nyssa sinensis]